MKAAVQRICRKNQPKRKNRAGLFGRQELTPVRLELTPLRLELTPGRLELASDRLELTPGRLELTLGPGAGAGAGASAGAEAGADAGVGAGQGAGASAGAEPQNSLTFPENARPRFLYPYLPIIYELFKIPTPLSSKFGKFR